MGNKTKPTIVGGAGTIGGSVWAAYANYTTASQLPTDAGWIAKMIADPPIYFPWLLIAISVLVLAWTFWPSNDDDDESRGVFTSGDASPIIQQNHTGVGHNINAHTVSFGPRFLEADADTLARIANELSKSRPVNIAYTNYGRTVALKDAIIDHLQRQGFEVVESVRFGRNSSPSLETALCISSNGIPVSGGMTMMGGQQVVAINGDIPIETK